MDRREHRLKALGNYLKSRRSRLTPGVTGLPDGHNKRRTVGLKREEVALLAGVSTTWYSWLEQGRDINVSSQVLESIARALKLSKDEYSHLLQLAQMPLTVPSSFTTHAIPSTLQKILDDLSSPAMLVNDRTDVLAWNSASCEYFGDYSKIPLHERNMTWQFFANPSLRDRIVNWEECAKSAVAIFRAFCDRNAGDPWVSRFVDDLSRISPFFKEQWSRYEVGGKKGNIIEFVDGCSFEVTSLQHNNGAGDIRFFVCTSV